MPDLLELFFVRPWGITKHRNYIKTQKSQHKLITKTPLGLKPDEKFGLQFILSISNQTNPIERIELPLKKFSQKQSEQLL